MTDKRPAPRKRGRPAFHDDNMSVLVKARVSPEMKAKYLALGGSAWLRKQIEQA